MSVAKLMTALMNEHNGPQETNRVQYSSVDRRWVIRPPLNYKHDSSLPPNKAIIDRRDKARLEYQARVLSQIIQKARDDKIAEQLIKNSLNEVRFVRHRPLFACARAATEAERGTEGTAVESSSEQQGHYKQHTYRGW